MNYIKKLLVLILVMTFELEKVSKRMVLGDLSPAVFRAAARVLPKPGKYALIWHIYPENLVR